MAILWLEFCVVKFVNTSTSRLQNKIEDWTMKGAKIEFLHLVFYKGKLLNMFYAHGSTNGNIMDDFCFIICYMSIKSAMALARVEYTSIRIMLNLFPHVSLLYHPQMLHLIQFKLLHE